MSNPSWDGPDLMGAISHAAAMLAAHVDEVNALNVFPVPDGDTGSNMLATIQSAREEADQIPAYDRSISRVTSAIALGALMGARGNSGVILSQLFRGINETLGKQEWIGGRELADAFDRGCVLAFAAVAHPVEGTILTVARAVAQRAAVVIKTDDSLEAVLEASVDEAQRTVLHTPEQLPMLREAGVVDAGGKGLELLLRGALGYQRREAKATVSRDLGHLPSFEALVDEGFGYETVYVILPFDGAELDPLAIRARLDQLGDSVLVAGDSSAVKIHVHNERPDEVIAYGLSLGSLSRITVENLDKQAQDRRRRAESTATQAQASSSGNGASGPAVVSSFVPVTASASSLPDGLAVVAVAPGNGIARLFGELGVTVVQGGQGQNPSAGELVAAIRATGRGEVIVLPNNSNVRLAAKQAGELLPDVKVNVVPTRNAAEGVAALLALDPQATTQSNVSRMTKSAHAIQTLQVTTAVRDSRMGRKKVKRGQHIVLDPDDGLLAADADWTAALSTGLAKLKPGFELLTLYYGEDVDRAKAEELADGLRPQLDGVEIELVEGGQPHYSLLVAAE